MPLDLFTFLEGSPFPPGSLYLFQYKNVKFSTCTHIHFMHHLRPLGWGLHLPFPKPWKSFSLHTYCSLHSTHLIVFCPYLHFSAVLVFCPCSSCPLILFCPYIHFFFPITFSSVLYHLSSHFQSLFAQSYPTLSLNLHILLPLHIWLVTPLHCQPQSLVPSCPLFFIKKSPN